MDTKALPTTSLAVETELRAMAQHVIDAKPGTIYYCENIYAYLFGMATVKLADANAEIERLKREAAREPLYAGAEPCGKCFQVYEHTSACNRSIGAL